jgi:hypothetical protein
MSDLATYSPPDLHLEVPSHPEWEENRAAFFRLVPSLLAESRGNYAAVHQGRVIALGPDQLEVAKAAYAQVGYLPVYVGLVTDEPPRPVRIPSPRWPRGKGL